MASGKIEMTGQWYITRNIYVDATNGNDGNDGKSQASAVKTLTGIQKCISEYADVYTLYFESGTYNLGSYNSLIPNNQTAIMRVIINGSVTFTADTKVSPVCGSFYLSISASATLTLDKNIMATIYGGYAWIGMSSNTKITGSGNIEMGHNQGNPCHTTIAMQSSPGTAEIGVQLLLDGGPIKITRVNGTNSVTKNITNYGAGIMKMDTGITYSGTATGIRIQNGTFYPS